MNDDWREEDNEWGWRESVVTGQRVLQRGRLLTEAFDSTDGSPCYVGRGAAGLDRPSVGSGLGPLDKQGACGQRVGTG